MIAYLNSTSEIFCQLIHAWVLGERWSLGRPHLILAQISPIYFIFGDCFMMIVGANRMSLIVKPAERSGASQGGLEWSLK